MFKKNIKSTVDRLGSNYEASSLTFSALDVEKIKQKFRLKEEAASRGTSNLPPKNATNFDDVEQKIISCIDSEIHKATESYHDHMVSFEQRINRLHAAGHVGTIENIAMKSEGDFAALVRRDATSLHTAKIAVKDSEVDLQNFKKENGLNRSARYPESRFLYFAVALLLITIETGVNGYFFAKGHEMGMLGGGFVALIPSFLNVLTGYYLGNYACRLAIHTSALKRYVGILMCAFLPLWCFGFNLLIAHYRTAMATMVDADIGDAAHLAVETFLSAPFNLQDVESWLLLITGCTFALIATLDFWKMDDAYPGFGERARDHNKKLQLYAHLKEDSLLELNELRDGNLEALEEASNLLNAKVNEANTIVDSQSRWKVLFAQHLNHLEDAGKQMLAYYRTQNMTTRTDEAPAYFNDQWNITKPVLTDTSIDFTAALSGFQSEAETMKTIYSSCVKRISDGFQKALEEYQTIEQLKPEELREWQRMHVVVDEKEKLSAAA